VILPDVSVLVAALRPDHPHHELAAAWYDNAHKAELGLTQFVVAGTLRVLTNPRIFSNPTPVESAVSMLGALLEQVPLVQPGAAHWQILAGLCRHAGVSGGGISDAQHAAVALELAATWVTTDSDFAKFPGLRWTNLLTGQTQVNHSPPPIP
jgi:toxin-antitoxin system PIN domain toxin